ncbi:hypothetical protein HFD91_11980 [Enterobacteriaceae bacterium EKM102V]|uniref:hypothetical protein n=1 Tax=Pantoea TaxID=53335 RepID=UPI00142DC4B8|nr:MULTISPECIES: hypothetical protein [Pantoea]KAF6659770.1 hypothetical protein HFD91_11980 [Enterobacteriaceae bacterium EKM102V]KAF6667805.1 hypothetical protein HFD97_11055 [Pantoea sp. EKM103V]
MNTLADFASRNNKISGGLNLYLAPSIDIKPNKKSFSTAALKIEKPVKTET